MNKVQSRRSQRPKGAILLFFLLFALPMLWLCGAIAVDYTRVVLGQRQAGQMADAASVAGAFQTLRNDPNNPYLVSSDLDTARARAVARDTIARSLQANVGRQITVTNTVVTAINPPAGTAAPSTVTVIVSYTVDDLLFLGILGDFGEADGVTSRTAFVCSPGTSETYNGSCARPRG